MNPMDSNANPAPSAEDTSGAPGASTGSAPSPWAARAELHRQRDLLRRPGKRIAAIAMAGMLAGALAVPSIAVFAQNAGATGSKAASTAAAAKSADAAGNGSDSGKTAQDYRKSQVIYVKTDGDGTKTGVYAVNSFDAAKGVRIDDPGAYTSVTNLSTTDALSDEGGAVTVVGQGDQGFSYQGDLPADTQLPWSIEVGYQLDGKPVSAKELAGKSGRLTMSLSVSKNSGYAGPDAYADNYLLQVTGQLDNAHAHHIAAEGATAAANGSNTQLTYMVLPGAAASYTLTADVEDFSFDGWQIVGVPLSLALDMDTADMDTSQLTELSRGIATANDGARQVDDGAAALAGALASAEAGGSQLNEGAAAAAAGADQLANGSAQVKDGVSGLEDGSDELAAGAGQVSDGLGLITGQSETLRQGAQQVLDGVNGVEGAVAAAAQQQQATVSQLAEQLVQLQSATTDEATKAALGQIVQNLQAQGSAGIDTSGIEALRAGAAALKSGVDSYTAGADQAAAGAQGVASGAFELKSGIAQLADGAAQVNDGLQQLKTQTPALSSGVSAITDALSQLHGGAAELADGTDRLASGASELAARTVNLDAQVIDTVRSEIERKLNPSFMPVDFVNGEQGGHIDRIQFVFMTGAIDA